MIIFESDIWFNLAVVVFLGAMTFVPVRFIHPMRVVALRRLNVPLVFIWAAMVFTYLGVGLSGARGALSPAMDVVFLALSLYFVVLSGWRSWSLRAREDRQ